MKDEPSEQAIPPSATNPGPSDDSPQVFALQKDGATWSLSRRGFMTGAAAGTGLVAGCKTSPSTTPAGATAPAPIPAAHENKVTAMLMTPKKDRLITGGEDSLVKVWQLPGGSLSATLSGLGGKVTAVAVSGDGARLAASDANGAVRIWSLAALQEVCTLHRGGSIDNLLFSNDGLRLYVRQGNSIAVLTLQKRSNLPVARLEVTKEASVVEPGLDQHAFVQQAEAAVSLTLCSDRSIRLRSLPDGAEMRTFRRSGLAAYGMSTSPSGGSVAVLTTGDNLEVWSLANGSMTSQLHLDGRKEALRMVNDTMVALLSNRTLRLYRIKPPTLELAEEVKLSPDADDAGSPAPAGNNAAGGGGGAPGSATPFLPGTSGSGNMLEVDLEQKVIIQRRGTGVATWSMRDGSRQVAFRDPAAAPPKVEPPPAPAVSVSPPPSHSPSYPSSPAPSSPSYPSGGGSRIIGHYWRPN
jgi:WD40 repeat protein